MPNGCGLCGGSGATTSVAGLALCDACAAVDPTEALTARGQPAVFRKAMLRFTAGVHVPGVPEGFVLRCAPERWTHAVAKLVVDEVEVGDPVFDDGVFVRTNDATTARRFLAPEGVQSALLALLAGARPEIVPNHVTLEGPTLTVSVRPLAPLDAEEWLRRQLASAALAVHWRQEGAQD